MNYYYHIIIVYVDFSCSNINYARKQTMRCYIYGIYILHLSCGVYNFCHSNKTRYSAFNFVRNYSLYDNYSIA